MSSIEWEPGETSAEYAGRPPYVQIPEKLILDPCLSAQASRVYSILAHHVNRTSGTAWPSIKSLGGYMGVKHLPTVRKYLQELHDAGWIEWKQRYSEKGKQTSNLYRLFLSPVERAGETGQGVANATSQGVANATSQGVANATTNHIELNQIELNQKEPPKPPTGGQRGTDGIVHIEGQTDVLELLNTEKPKRKRADGATEEQFSEFWNIYPRRTAKATARTALGKALQRATFQQIMDGAARYAADPNRVERFTKHPATWLNGECWDDEPLPSRLDTGAPSTMERMQHTMAIGAQLQEQLNSQQQARQHAIGFNSGHVHAEATPDRHNEAQARAIEAQLGQLGKMD